jgi:hypothetical protein
MPKKTHPISELDARMDPEGQQILSLTAYGIVTAQPKKNTCV